MIYANFFSTYSCFFLFFILFHFSYLALLERLLPLPIDYNPPLYIVKKVAKSITSFATFFSFLCILQLNCRLLRFRWTRQAYYPRTGQVRDTYQTIEARKSSFSSRQSFRLLRFGRYTKVSPGAAQGQRDVCYLDMF